MTSNKQLKDDQIVVLQYFNGQEDLVVFTTESLEAQIRNQYRRKGYRLYKRNDEDLEESACYYCVHASGSDMAEPCSERDYSDNAKQNCELFYPKTRRKRKSRLNP